MAMTRPIATRCASMWPTVMSHGCSGYLRRCCCMGWHTKAKAAQRNHDAKRVALALALILISGAPLNHAGRNSTGIWGVNRQGCRFSRPAPWMARGGGPPNHWRITGTPSLGEVPSGGARAFCLLLRFSKVSRCKSGTLSGRYRRNGYVLGINSVACQVAIAGKPAPTFGTLTVR